MRMLKTKTKNKKTLILRRKLHTSDLLFLKEPPIYLLQRNPHSLRNPVCMCQNWVAQYTRMVHVLTINQSIYDPPGLTWLTFSGW